MAVVSINKEKCINCSICSKVCLCGVFKKNSTEEFPGIDAEIQNDCLNCGHCVAYCPSGAVTINFPDEMPYNGNCNPDTITPEQIRHHMSNRRSVRRFKKMSVERKVLEELMDIVRYAPTGGNCQNVRWIIVHNTERLKALLYTAMIWAKQKLVQGTAVPDLSTFLQHAIDSWENGEDMICRKAPHLAIAYSPEIGLFPAADAVIAGTYLELAAVTYGIGTCWTGLFQILAYHSEDLRRELGIPEGHTIYAALMLGYPEFTTKRIPKRNNINVKWM